MMHDLEEIRSKTLHLMDTLGRQQLGRSLRDAGWTFRFDRARRRMGACRWSTDGRHKILSLSRHYALLNGWRVMEDVARHEIAHALDYETRGRSDHGRAWKTWARRCGADPSRLYEGGDLRAAEGRYVGRCPHCGAERTFYRLPKRSYACRACCDRHSGGRYTNRFRLVLYDRKTSRKVETADERKRPTSKYTGTCPRCGTQVGFARKVKRPYACAACCSRYADGTFDARFAYVIRQNY